MKKDRNTFFSNYSTQTQGYIPDFQNNIIQPNLPNNQPLPFNQTSINSNYYSIPDNIVTDIDNRLSKIERQVNRLDTRLSNLENNKTPEITENNYSNNMYML